MVPSDVRMGRVPEYLAWFHACELEQLPAGPPSSQDRKGRPAGGDRKEKRKEKGGGGSGSNRWVQPRELEGLEFDREALQRAWLLREAGKYRGLGGPEVAVMVAMGSEEVDRRIAEGVLSRLRVSAGESASRSHDLRKGAIVAPGPERIYLSRATLVVVPRVLIGHWQQQVMVRGGAGWCKEQP